MGAMLMRGILVVDVLQIANEGLQTEEAINALRVIQSTLRQRVVDKPNYLHGWLMDRDICAMCVLQMI